MTEKMYLGDAVFENFLEAIRRNKEEKVDLEVGRLKGLL